MSINTNIIQFPNKLEQLQEDKKKKLFEFVMKSKRCY